MSSYDYQKDHRVPAVDWSDRAVLLACALVIVAVITGVLA